LLPFVIEIKINHLQVLGSPSTDGPYFQPGEVSISQGWIQNPFIFSPESIVDNDGIKEVLT